MSYACNKTSRYYNTVISHFIRTALFWGLFLSREWLCLGALYRDLGQKIPDLVKTAYKCTGRQSAVKFNKIREKCEKSDTEQGSASSLNARLFRADVEKGTILI